MSAIGDGKTILFLFVLAWRICVDMINAIWTINSVGINTYIDNLPI